MAQHIAPNNDVGALLAKIASAFTVDMFQLQTVLFQLQKAPVNIEKVRRPQMGLVDQFPLSVTQNLLKIDRRHRLKVSAQRRQFNR